MRTWLLTSGWCQLWNHFSLDWAILSSESLCSIQPNFFQPLRVSSTPSVCFPPGASGQKREPYCNRHVISQPNSDGPGIAQQLPSTQQLQAHFSSALTSSDTSQPDGGSMSTPSRQSPQDARLSFLPERTTKILGFKKICIVQLYHLRSHPVKSLLPQR